MVKIVIVGAGQNGGQIYNILKLDKEATIVGFLDDDPGDPLRWLFGVVGFTNPVIREKQIAWQEEVGRKKWAYLPRCGHSELHPEPERQPLVWIR